MFDDDLPDAARHATAANVLQCLTMLSEEAENLNLPRTMLALRKAIRVCVPAGTSSSIRRGARGGAVPLEPRLKDAAAGVSRVRQLQCTKETEVFRLLLRLRRLRRSQERHNFAAATVPARR